jgi:ATP-dependent Clp protease protease subunit
LPDDGAAQVLPNPPLQRTWSSLTLGTTPLNASAVSQTVRSSILTLLTLGAVILARPATADESERLRRTREVLVLGAIDDKLATETIAKLLFVDSQATDKPITLAIDSPGGQLVALIAILDTMKGLRSRVRTECSGKAEGVAAVLLASGHRGDRVASAACHVTFAGLHSNSPELKARREVIRRLAEVTGQLPQKVTEDALRNRRFLPREAVDYGLVDHVRKDSSDSR